MESLTPALKAYESMRKAQKTYYRKKSCESNPEPEVAKVRGRPTKTGDEKKARRSMYMKQYYKTHPEKWNRDSPTPKEVCVYTIENNVNDFFYVGESKNVKQRWSNHRSTTCKKFPEVPKEAWVFSVFLHLPIFDVYWSTLALESLTMYYFVKKGKVLQNKQLPYISGIHLRSELLKYVYPYLDRFDDENRTKLLSIIDECLGKNASPYVWVAEGGE